MKISARLKQLVIVLCIIVGMLIFWGLGGLTSAIYAQQPQQKLVWQMTAEDHYVKGLEVGSIRGGAVPAISSFTQAIRLNPNYAEAYLERGKARRRRNIQDAISDFNQAIRLNPSYAEAYFERARSYYSIGEKQQAINDLTMSIQDSPTYAEAYYQRGLIYSELLNKQAAVEDYVQVIRLDPENRAYRDDNQRAIQNYEKLTGKNLDFAHAYYQELARQYLSDRDFSFSPENPDDLDRTIELNSSYADAYYYLMTDLTKAIQLNPNFAEAYYWRGVKRLGLDRDYRFNVDASPNSNPLIAIPDFTKAIELKPDYADAYYVRGLAYSRMGQNKEAISDFIQALQLSPGNDPNLANEFIQILKQDSKTAVSYYRRGIVRFNLLDFKGALEDFTSAIQLNQNLAEAYYYRGLIGKILPRYGYKGSYEEYRRNATADFTKALQLKPDFIDAYIGRAFALTGRELQVNFKQINIDTTKAIQLNPTIGESFYARGFINNDRQEDYIQAIRIAPNFAFTYYKAGYGDCGGRGGPDKSTLFPEFNPDFSAGDHFAKTFALSGMIRLQIDQQKEAIKRYSQTIQEDSRNADSYYGRGFAYLYLGEMQTAIQDFNQAIQINPQDANAYYRRGMAYYRQKKYKQALADYTQAIQINPSSADVYLMRGLANYDSGNQQQAFEDTNQAIRLDPLFAEAYFIRGRVFSDLGYKGAAWSDFNMAGGHWPCYSMCCGGSSIQGNPIALLDRGRELGRRGDKRGALQNLIQAATLFQKQGNTDRYQQTTELIRQFQK